MTLLQAPIRYSPDELAKAESAAGVEFVDGQIVEKPMSFEATDIEDEILTLLRLEAKKTRSVRAFGSGMGYQCFRNEPRQFRKPDVSVIRADRLVGFDPQTGLVPFAPDLAVEVISPNDTSYDVKEKFEEYLANGFPLIWVVHPNTRTVAVHRADGSVTVLHERDEISGETAFPSFRCKVAAFFDT